MAANYVLLEKITVGAAGVASVTFNSIPQTGYTDLKLVFSTRGTQSALYDGTFLYFNGSNTSVSGKVLTGSGAAAGSANPTTALGYFDGSGATATANTFGNGEVYIPNYTSSNYKSISGDTVSENNGTNAYSALSAGLWSSTNPITTITLKPAASSNFAQYSTFYLYGLAAVGATPAIAPYASGGDIVQTDGTYWYHAFLSSGSFTPKKALSCDVLVVAGGGGGGWAGAGGGAGGLQAFTSQSLASGTSYTTTVGAGGAKGLSASRQGSNGVNSSFGALTASVGGGGGGAFSNSRGSTGGSGGGSSADYTSAGGLATSGQGNAGGAGGNTTGTGYGTGGGGGAGAVGSNGTNSAGGAGGAGVNTYSSWLTPTGLGVSGYLAGGGGGGTVSSSYPAGAGGAGGGGAGNNVDVGYSATPNTGGGGGAGWNGGSGVSNDGGNGGSGLVIVRYAI